jgi:hypothetical protein
MDSVARRPSAAHQQGDLPAESTNAQRVLAFCLSDAKQVRLGARFERLREGTLMDDESAELAAYERFEPVGRLLKARVPQQRGS